MAVKAYSFNNTAKRVDAIRRMKVLFRGGLNAASGNFPIGSNVRIRNNRPGGRR
jgi:hypothetical protein